MTQQKKPVSLTWYLAVTSTFIEWVGTSEFDKILFIFFTSQPDDSNNVSWCIVTFPYKKHMSDLSKTYTYIQRVISRLAVVIHFYCKILESPIMHHYSLSRDLFKHTWSIQTHVTWVDTCLIHVRACVYRALRLSNRQLFSRASNHSFRIT